MTNLHHAKSSTSLIVDALHLAQTKKQKLIVLAQEPYIIGNKATGFDTQLCNVFYLSQNMKLRTCIVATEDVGITLLPQFCNGDITTVMVNTGTTDHNEEFVLSSAYLPYDATETRPGKMVIDLSEFCSVSGRPLILGSDTNSHHTLWGSSDTNQRGEELVEFLAASSLEILNKGNEPTFVTSNRSEVLDVTFVSRDFLERIIDWHVSREETLSDHKEINFKISMVQQDRVLFRNPRNTNWEIYSTYLEEYLGTNDWAHSIDTHEQLDLMVEKLSNGLHGVFIQACPGRYSKPKRNQWWCKKLA